MEDGDGDGDARGWEGVGWVGLGGWVAVVMIRWLDGEGGWGR